MSLPFDKILIKHWVRSHANKVEHLFNSENVVKKDFRMYYVKIKDSIHYRALLNNDYVAYNEYINTACQLEHSEEKFKKLTHNFNFNNLDKIKIKYDGQHFCILDGVHRTSILFLIREIHKINGLSIKFLSIEYPDYFAKEIGEALIKTTETKHYNGWCNSRKEYGYHSFNIQNLVFIGQRDPIKRLTEMRKFFDFTGKYVLDFGCNSGGMLFHLFEISKGLGIDFDSNCINACNLIKERLAIFDNIDFIKRDIQKEEIIDIFNRGKPDVIFLLSLGSWLKNWGYLYETVAKNTDVIFLETNNDDEGAPQIDFFKNLGWSIDLVIEKSLDDCTNNTLRKTYIIKKGLNSIP